MSDAFDCHVNNLFRTLLIFAACILSTFSATASGVLVTRSELQIEGVRSDSLSFEATVTINPANHLENSIHRGVNVFGRYSDWVNIDWSKRVKLLNSIKKFGFDHIRMNLYVDRWVSVDGRVNSSFIHDVEETVDAAALQGLKVVVDFHDFILCRQNLDRCKTVATSFWSEASITLGGKSNVLFDLMNEPSGKISPEIWRELRSALIALIKKSAPTVPIIVSAPHGGDFQQLSSMREELDGADYLTAHYYRPMRFTHQGAPWVKHLRDMQGVRWGEKEDYSLLQADVDKLSEMKALLGLPLYVGEIGVYDRALACDREKYLAALTAALENHGISWALWQLEFDFRLYDSEFDSWNLGLISAVIDKKTPSCGSYNG